MPNSFRHLYYKYNQLSVGIALQSAVSKKMESATGNTALSRHAESNWYPTRFARDFLNGSDIPEPLPQILFFIGGSQLTVSNQLPPAVPH